jgi:hypothetical protein
MPWKEAAIQICILHQQAVLLLILPLNLILLQLQLLPLLLSHQKWLSLLAMGIPLFSLVIRMQQHHSILEHIPVARRILDSSSILNNTLV